MVGAEVLSRPTNKVAECMGSRANVKPLPLKELTLRYGVPRQRILQARAIFCFMHTSRQRSTHINFSISPLPVWMDLFVLFSPHLHVAVPARSTPQVTH